MGEYAKRTDTGTSIKIGTCESMYYLRADQRHLVQHEPGNVNPNGADALSIRFPWPDEDKIEPGNFENYGRSVAVDGVSIPANLEHYTVQFSAHAGYLVSLPCPEGHQGVLAALTIHRNGFAGAVKLVQQKLLADGRLVPVCECGGCGTAWRIEEPAEIEALAVAFRAEGDRRGGTFFQSIADRILEGAGLALAGVEGE